MRMKKRTIIMFIGPALALYMLIFLYPVVRTTAMTFFNTQSISSSLSKWRFVGLENYAELFTRRSFNQSLLNIGKIWLYCGIAVFILSMFFALMLTSGMKGKNFFRAVIYLPNVISGIAMAYMWQLYVFNGNFGMLKTLFKTLGMTGAAKFAWLSPGNMFLSMCIAYVFSSVGYFMMTYMAAIEGIPKDFYEAATIEGAGDVRRFVSITLPLIKDTLVSTITLWTTRVMGFYALSVVFSSINTITPMLFTYNTLFGTEESSAAISVGVASASALVMTGMIVIIFLLTNLIKTERYEY